MEIDTEEDCGLACEKARYTLKAKIKKRKTKRSFVPTFICSNVHALDGVQDAPGNGFEGE